MHALAEAAVERDALAMTRVQTPSLLKRLLELGSELSGQASVVYWKFV